jgi:phosphinothricin acetyltransferase
MLRDINVMEPRVSIRPADVDDAASIRLHEKFGFRHVGVFRDVGFKFDRWLDTVLMQRAL